MEQVWIPVAVLAAADRLAAHAAAVLERGAAHAGSSGTALNDAMKRNGELFRKTQTDSVRLTVHHHPATGHLVTNERFLPTADLVRILGLTASQSPATV